MNHGEVFILGLLCFFAVLNCNGKAEAMPEYTETTRAEGTCFPKNYPEKLWNDGSGDEDGTKGNTCQYFADNRRECPEYDTYSIIPNPCCVCVHTRQACEDYRKDCKDLKDLCDGPVKKQCPKTCNVPCEPVNPENMATPEPIPDDGETNTDAVCRDAVTGCEGMKEAGYCNKKEVESAMKVNCAKTCNFCEVCRDTVTGCEGMKEAGYCNKKEVESAMKKNCKKACNFCEENDEKKIVDDDLDTEGKDEKKMPSSDFDTEGKDEKKMPGSDFDTEEKEKKKTVNRDVDEIYTEIEEYSEM